MTAVLDASAVLAWLRNEPGADEVHPLLPTAVMSAANWSKTWQTLHQHRVDADRATSRLRTLGVRVEPLPEADAVTATKLVAHPRGRPAPGYRCCLALAAGLALTTVTADNAWADLDFGIPVRIIR